MAVSALPFHSFAAGHPDKCIRFSAKHNTDSSFCTHFSTYSIVSYPNWPAFITCVSSDMNLRDMVMISCTFCPYVCVCAAVATSSALCRPVCAVYLWESSTLATTSWSACRRPSDSCTASWSWWDCLHRLSLCWCVAADWEITMLFFCMQFSLIVFQTACWLCFTVTVLHI